MLVTKILNRLGVLALCLFCVACSLKSRAADGDGVVAAGLTPREWAALSKPGPSHKLLAAFVGEWDVKMTFWSDPLAKGESSAGVSQTSWILGDRFVQEQFIGSIAGEEYRGLGIMGYDNGSRTFKTVWADSLNTALTTSTGRYHPDTSAITLESEVYDPLVSGVKTVQSSLRFDSPQSYVFTMTDTSPEGKRFTSLEMRYTKKMPAK